MKEMTIPNYGIVVRVDCKGVGTIQSSLRNHLLSTDDTPSEAKAIKMLCDAIEALVLAQACQGIEFSPQYLAAFDTAMEAICNRL